MKCLQLSRVGVVLLRLRIGLFQIVFKRVKLRVSSKLLKTCSATEELDSCRLIREDNGPIRCGTMTDDYREVFAALKSRTPLCVSDSTVPKEVSDRSCLVLF
jgi:hypothetical protein